MESVGVFIVLGVLAFIILGIVLVLAPLKLYSIHRELKHQSELLTWIGNRIPAAATTAAAPAGELQAR
jgi:predicted transcriptional regulator